MAQALEAALTTAAQSVQPTNIARRWPRRSDPEAEPDRGQTSWPARLLGQDVLLEPGPVAVEAQAGQTRSLQLASALTSKSHPTADLL